MNLNNVVNIIQTMPAKTIFKAYLNILSFEIFAKNPPKRIKSIKAKIIELIYEYIIISELNIKKGIRTKNDAKKGLNPSSKVIINIA